MHSTVTDKGQVTLPKALRDQLGIGPGTKLEFVLQPDGTVRLRVLARGSANLFGLLAAPGEAARSAGQIDAGVTAAVTARSKAR